jgi:hypothetical protein
MAWFSRDDVSAPELILLCSPDLFWGLGRA